MGDPLQVLTNVRLPSFPRIVTRVQELYDRGANFNDFADLLSSDSGLAMRIVQAANSPLFVTENDVADLQDAIKRLGTGRLMEIVYALKFCQLASSSGLSIEDYWQETLFTAVVARKLAEHCELDKPSRFFTLGLFSNLGILLKMILNDDETRQVVQISKESHIARHIAQEKLGFTSEVALCEVCLLFWGFPNDVRVPVAFQMKPDKAPLPSRLDARVLNTAAHMRNLRFSDVGEPHPSEAKIYRHSLKKMLLDEESVENMSESACLEVKAMQSFISLAPPG